MGMRRWARTPIVHHLQPTFTRAWACVRARVARGPRPAFQRFVPLGARRVQQQQQTMCEIWSAPSACVTLLDSDHVYICATHGFEPAHAPWSIAMCPWMLLTPTATTMAVPDLGQVSHMHAACCCGS